MSIESVDLSSSVAPFSFCLQSFPASRYFPMSQLFTSGGHSTGTSAWAWILLMNIQGWFPLGLTSLISLERDSQKSSPAQQFKSINSSVLNLLHGLALTSIHNTGRNIALTVAAAAAKLLQSCPTLCDPIDGSSPGSPVPGILQARTLEWVAISFSNEWKWKVKVKSLSRVQRPHGL